MPTKNTLWTMIAVQIAALLGGAVAATVSIPSLVRDYALPTYVFSASAEIFWLANIVSVAFVLVAIGLCFFADIFRTLYVALTVAALLLHSLHPSVSSGSMDLLHQTDAVLRGAIMALVYFSALSDLYKPRPQRDLNSTQRLFRYLILAQIGLMLAIVAAGFLSAAGNNEIAAINDAMDSGHPGRGALAGTTLLAYVIVNVCLYKFWKGARTAYLIVTVVAILETLYLSPSATSAGTEIFTDGITILNGALLGLAYFSPLRAVFDGPAGTRTVAAPAPVMSPPVGSPVTAVSSDSPHPHFTPAPVAAAPVAPANTASPPTTPVVAPASRAAHTRFCSECGARVDDAKFCPECGQRQRPKDECAGCGAKLHGGSRFCAECGVQVV